MSDDWGQRAEGDLFDLWPTHRDAEGEPGASTRDRTRPPAWAPAVATPAGEQAAVVTPPTEPADEQGTPTLEPPVVVLPLAEEPVRDRDAPIRMTFRPRTRARAAVAIGTLLAAAASVMGTYVASRDHDTASIGIAVTLWVLTGIIWSVHSGTSVTRLSVRGGQLQVLQRGVRTTIDLTSSYTPVEVHGRPGRHGWKVVFLRRDMSPFVIDNSMVDPNEFMRVLRYYRPGVGDAEA